MSGYIYLLRATGTNRYKIGRSKNPKSRSKRINYQSPVPVVLLDEFKCNNPVEAEKTIHRDCGRMRKHGEWFEFESEERARSLFNFHRITETGRDEPRMIVSEIGHYSQPSDV